MDQQLRWRQEKVDREKGKDFANQGRGAEDRPPFSLARLCKPEVGGEEAVHVEDGDNSVGLYLAGVQTKPSQSTTYQKSYP